MQTWEEKVDVFVHSLDNVYAKYTNQHIGMHRRGKSWGKKATFFNNFSLYRIEKLGECVIWKLYLIGINMYSNVSVKDSREGSNTVWNFIAPYSRLNGTTYVLVPNKTEVLNLVCTPKLSRENFWIGASGFFKKNHNYGNKFFEIFVENQ